MADLARQELEAPAGALVVEEDPGAGVQPVALPVVHGDPVGIDLGHPVRAPRVERRGLRLWNLPDLAEHLAGAGLVEADRRVHDTDGVQ